MGAGETRANLTNLLDTAFVQLSERFLGQFIATYTAEAKANNNHEIYANRNGFSQAVDKFGLHNLLLLKDQIKAAQENNPGQERDLSFAELAVDTAIDRKIRSYSQSTWSGQKFDPALADDADPVRLTLEDVTQGLNLSNLPDLCLMSKRLDALSAQTEASIDAYPIKAAQAVIRQNIKEATKDNLIKIDPATKLGKLAVTALAAAREAGHLKGKQSQPALQTGGSLDKTQTSHNVSM